MDRGDRGDRGDRIAPDLAWGLGLRLPAPGGLISLIGVVGQAHYLVFSILFWVNG